MQETLFDIEVPLVGTWVYVIGPKDSSIVKIGKATDVPDRLASIQTGNPEPLVIRWGCIGGRPLEADLHRTFKRLRKAGEWFDFGDADPVEAVHAAVKALRPGQPIYIYGVHYGSSLYPSKEDPHHDDPEYQPDAAGCRLLTPTERFLLGREVKPDATVFRCGSGGSTLCRCWN